MCWGVGKSSVLSESCESISLLTIGWFGGVCGRFVMRVFELAAILVLVLMEGEMEVFLFDCLWSWLVMDFQKYLFAVVTSDVVRVTRLVWLLNRLLYTSLASVQGFFFRSCFTWKYLLIAEDFARCVFFIMWRCQKMIFESLSFNISRQNILSDWVQCCLKSREQWKKETTSRKICGSFCNVTATVAQNWSKPSRTWCLEFTWI